jgi:hypothetical protein
MKLILKRVPRDNTVVIGAAGDWSGTPKERGDERRPLALFTEDGELLPRQTSVSTESLPGQYPTVTVTFFLDGKDIKVVGDD